MHETASFQPSNEYLRSTSGLSRNPQAYLFHVSVEAQHLGQMRSFLRLSWLLHVPHGYSRMQRVHTTQVVGSGDVSVILNLLVFYFKKTQKLIYITWAYRSYRPDLMWLQLYLWLHQRREEMIHADIHKINSLYSLSNTS